MRSRNPLNTAAGRLHSVITSANKLFSTVPAGDLTQICFSQDSRREREREYVNK